MTVFEIKRNDTKPYIAATLEDSAGSAIDLNDTVVYFNLGTNDNVFYISVKWSLCYYR